MKISMNFQRGVFLTAAFIIMAACGEKEDTPEPMPLVSWEKSDNFPEGLFNAQVINDRLFVVSSGNFYFDAKITSPNNPVSFRNLQTRVGRFKLPVSDRIFATRTETEIYLFPSNDITAGKALKINAKDLDPDFLSFEDIPFWQGDVFSINNAGSILIPYRASAAGMAKNSPFFFLLKPEIINGNVQLSSFVLIREDLIDWFDSCNRVESAGDFFFVQVGSSTFHISNSGAVQKASDFSARLFSSRTESFTMTMDRNSGQFTLRKGSLNGSNWSEMGRFTFNQTLRALNYCIIDNKIIGFNGSEIYELTPTGNNIQIKRLEDKNLEGGVISSIVQWNDRVFVSVICDNPIRNCGGFHKSLTDFFKEKQSSS